MLGGAATDEVILVVLILALVMVAPKVGRIGERIGAAFERTAPRDEAPSVPSAPPAPATDSPRAGAAPPEEPGGA